MFLAGSCLKFRSIQSIFGKYEETTQKKRVTTFILQSCCPTLLLFIYLYIFFIYLNAGSHHVAQTGFRLMILCCRLQGTRFTWFCLLLCVWVFAYIVFVDYMCIPGAHRSHRLFPWNWSNKWLLATMWLWESNLGLLEEHLVFLTTESPPQLPSGS